LSHSDITLTLWCRVISLCLTVTHSDIIRESDITLPHSASFRCKVMHGRGRVKVISLCLILKIFILKISFGLTLVQWSDLSPGDWSYLSPKPWSMVICQTNRQGVGVPFHRAGPERGTYPTDPQSGTPKKEIPKNRGPRTGAGILEKGLLELELETVM